MNPDDLKTLKTVIDRWWDKALERMRQDAEARIRTLDACLTVVDRLTADGEPPEDLDILTGYLQAQRRDATQTLQQALSYA